MRTLPVPAPQACGIQSQLDSSQTTVNGVNWPHAEVRPSPFLFRAVTHPFACTARLRSALLHVFVGALVGDRVLVLKPKAFHRHLGQDPPLLLAPFDPPMGTLISVGQSQVIVVRGKPLPIPLEPVMKSLNISLRGSSIWQI